MGACLLYHEVSDDTKVRWCSVIQFNSQSLMAFLWLNTLRWNGWHSLTVFVN